VKKFIGGVDQMAQKRLPLAVILCTNRLAAIDPAVRRRAADVFEFGRPNVEQRRAVLREPLQEIGFSTQEIDAVVQMTGASTPGEIGFAFSDLTQRLIPTLVLDAYPDRSITFSRAVELIRQMRPTPPFGHDGVTAQNGKGKG
jgi:AAA+ superfamily predicted ATPase